MNRAVLLLGVLLSAFEISAWAQTQSMIRISVPEGALFVVDGQQYRTTANFTWPTGSKHILQWIGGTFPDEGRMFLFTGWRDNLGLLTPTEDLVQTITADPRVTELKTGELAYRVILDFFI